MDWNTNLQVRGMEEAELKALTTTVTLEATIPTIWSPRLEKNYERIVKMPQFAIQNTELLGRPGDEVIISKMTDIGPAEDLEKTGPAGQTARGAETRWNNTTAGIETAFESKELVKLIPTVKFKAVKFTRKAMNRSFVGRMSDATEGLAYSFQLKMDMDCFESLDTAASAIVGPASWAALLVGDLFDTDKVMQAKLRYDIQVEINEWAYFPAETLVCLIHPYQAYHLQKDVDWFDVVKRNAARAIFKGELVEWSGIRFVKSTGVPYYAGGALTNVAGAQDMVPIDGATVPNDTWMFSTDGTYANRTGFIAPRYQTAGGPATDLTITLDPSDAEAKITMIDHHNGIVKFDITVGGTNPPTASFAYGSVHGYSSPVIGPRAFAIAWKERPRMTQEITNYGMFVGIGGTSDYDVQLLNQEQVVVVHSAVNPPFSMAP
jgi:N4-gp56 family major capsid protein